MNLASTHRTLAIAASLVLCSVALLTSPSVEAGGFEIADNTTKSIARGGTGAALKRDPGALYYNPALLTGVGGTQILLNSNFSKLNLEFQRAPLTEGGETTNFDPVTNDDGIFTAPFLAASYQIIPDKLTVGLGIFGPSAYGTRCFGERVDGECTFDERNAARHMILASSIIELYGTLGAAYKIDLGPGELSLGLAGILGHQRAQFDIVVYANTSVGEETEDPADEALFQGRNLTDWQPSGIIGLAYALDGLHIGASYRLPFSWSAEGEAVFTPPETFAAIGVELRPDDVVFETNQAGTLRAAVGYEHFRNPEADTRPLFDIAFDFVWEDWSRVENFVFKPEGDVYIGGSRNPINDVYQPKGYQDTFAFRLGGGYNATDWLKINAGGFYETAAQPEEYTSVDFVSWQRYATGGGLTLRPADWIDIDLAYMHIFSPDRTVEDGQIYNPIVFSQCTGPDYQDDACEEPGTPPGNPQNNGEWSSSFDFASIGVTLHYD